MEFAAVPIIELISMSRTCGHCGAANDESLIRCALCGHGLSRTCAVCGMESPAVHKFCGGCGTLLQRSERNSPTASPYLHHVYPPLPGTPDADELPQAERKHVTVLFADIKGSMEILAARDPEDANRILDNTLHRMMDAVHRYEGTVSQARGDGIMAIFGAPLAHEDHAARACYAALQIQKDVGAYSEEALRTEGVPVVVRVGINSGEAVVRTIRNDFYVEYTAVGETAHVAARMEQAATPGSILATASTCRLLNGSVHCRSIGEVAVRGLSHSLEAFEIVAAAGRAPRLQAPGPLTKFVAREVELQTLEQLLAEVREGSGRAVAIGGEAGVGKSRLVREFLRRHRAGCLVMEAHPARFGEAVSPVAMVELLRVFFDLAADDGAALMREKITTRLARRLPSMLSDLAPLLDVLDALPADHPFHHQDTSQRRQATIGAIVALLVSESRVQPVLAVFEDLQWNDSLSLALLAELVASMQTASILVVACHRPGHRPAWASAAGARHISLAPLAPDGTAALLGALLGEDDLQSLEPLLHERAGGNPFFIEEIVQLFVGSGALVGSPGAYRRAGELPLTRIPATVGALLASRIDRLASADKQLLQQAAAIGHHVDVPTLQALTQLPAAELTTRLAHLESADFICRTALYPEQTYTFKHALTQEVAYNELVHDRRREIHARITEAMEQLHEGRLSDVIDQIAQHALRGRLWGKALAFLRQAAARAADRHAYVEAVALLEQALTAIEPLAMDEKMLRDAIDIRFEMRNALQPLGDRQRMAKVLQDAGALAAKLGDPARSGWVQAYLTDHFWIRGLAREAAEAGEQALRIARDSADLAMQVVTRLPLGLVHHTRGDYRKALIHFDWNIGALTGELESRSFGLFVLPSSFSRSFRAWALADMGDFPAALVDLRRGDLLNAVSTLERALSRPGFGDSPLGIGYVAFHLGYAKVLSGAVDAGLADLEAAVRLADEKGFVARHALRLAHLAQAYAAAGRLKEADTTVERAIALSIRHEESANQAHALRTKGLVDLCQGRLAQADAAFREALALAGKLRMRPVQGYCLRGLARVAALHGRNADAESNERKAARLARQLGMTFH
jgi:class 3 adenylate cyclase/tetratricopeptide (TPR) repeat protein